MLRLFQPITNTILIFLLFSASQYQNVFISVICRSSWWIVAIFYAESFQKLEEIEISLFDGYGYVCQAYPSFCKISRGTPRNFSGRSNFDQGIEDQGIVNQYREF